MLALTAAGSVFEMDIAVHRFSVLSFFILRKFWSLLSLLSGCNLLGHSLGSDSNGPDEAQQLSSNCCDNLPLVFAGGTQFHIALVQPMLRLPSSLLIETASNHRRAFPGLLREAVPIKASDVSAPRGMLTSAVTGQHH